VRQIAPSVAPSAGSGRIETNLANSSYILGAVLFAETEVLVQPKPDVVSVQSVREPLQVEEVLFECYGDRGLSRHQKIRCITMKTSLSYLSTGAEASEPDCEASLAKELMAFFRSDHTLAAIHVNEMITMV